MSCHFNIPDSLTLIAGQADYPLLLARAARRQGVRKITAVAFKGETRREICEVADEVIWIRVGQLTALLDAVQSAGSTSAVMAGQITPNNLFNVRMDRALIDLLRKLPMKNAHTIFGAIIERIEQTGVTLLSAGSFMQDFMPVPGLLTRRAPDDRELADIQIGRRVIKDTSHLDIGQTVVVKEGMVLAVEAFEGTNRAIRRGGKLGGPGAVVVKVPKVGHDMRFDIPVIGKKTLQIIKKAKVSCLALEEDGAILLEKEKLVRCADQLGIAIQVLNKQPL
ncbi:LpxI family protein [Tichowtungia aerotolerans]|uniref:UDP-2,3-diacylglucosamine diphosphatase LpxI n=1 Tax=Tichowtungia aerotolerans TaxID=2697043 RepID=A0A6P1MA07_9BACT|nr:UDP-2,3-diacylglucosamine diphosphatase LpxI [Tichowtungia aerotolerans]QHI67955.1 UDP-2,3-diacylglucosamine diphosphatase LpxI [Tichowtungia aerotolerans]